MLCSISLRLPQLELQPRCFLNTGHECGMTQRLAHLRTSLTIGLVLPLEEAWLDHRNHAMTSLALTLRCSSLRPAKLDPERGCLLPDRDSGLCA